MTNFFNLEDAINSKIDGTSKNEEFFIIANERLKNDKTVGRIFTVIPNFIEFLNNRKKYKHCHEIIADHKNNKPNLEGRLVFDFDIKYNEKLIIPSNFKKQIQFIIVKVIKNFYVDVDTSILQFVWSTSENSKKLSKHLTVKNLYFEEWITMTKTFYQLFCHLWDEQYNWIHSDNLIDFQIVRKNASLRMVGSSKIGGNILKFDDDGFNLTDSLIRIYTKRERTKEQMITDSNIDHIEQEKILYVNVSDDNKNISIGSSKMQNVILDPMFEYQVYEKAFEICNIICPDVFKMGKINGHRLDIMRLKKHKCIMSNKTHERENAFLIIYITGLIYNVRFGCYRYCNKESKTYHIGDFFVATNEIRHIDHIDDSFLT